jgi:hypothetical protein
VGGCCSFLVSLILVEFLTTSVGNFSSHNTNIILVLPVVHTYLEQSVLTASNIFFDMLTI